MADGRRDVEFAVRVKDLGTKSFNDVANAVEKVTASIDDQTAAAKKGEVSAGELRDTLKQLEQAGAALVKQQGTIDLYRKLSEQLADSEAKAAGLREEFAKANQTGGLAGFSQKQVVELGKLQKALEGAERKVETTQAALAVQAEKLNEAGISTSALAQAQANIATTATKVGQAVTIIDAALTNYNATLRETRTQQSAANAEVKKAADDASFRKIGEDAAAAVAGLEGFTGAATKGADSAEAQQAVVAESAAAFETAKQKVLDLAEAIRTAEAPSEALTTSLRAARTELAATGATLERETATLGRLQAQQEATVAKTTAEAAAFRQLAIDAMSSVNSFDAMQAAERKAATASSSLAAALHGLLDPSAAAVTTLAGLEERTTKIAADIGDAQKPISSYTDAINGLSQAQSAILNQARAVDSYRNQTEAVNQASAAYETAREKVVSLAAAVRTAREPDDALAASLRSARAELAQTNTQLDAEQSKLDRLGAALTKAGVDTNDLSAAERRLTATSQVAAAAAQKLAGAQAGTNSASGRFLGLRPYELQNLSYQINDVFTQLASGTSITQTFAQQGGQFAQIFPGLISGIVRFIPEIAVATGVIYTFYAAIKRVFDLEAAGRKFASMLAVTADSARYNATSLALQARALEDLGVSLKDAEAALVSFTKAGLDPSQLEAFGKAARDMARVTGQDVPTSAARLAASFHTGFDAVAKLDDEFNFLTAAERTHIKALFDSGQAVAARTEAFRIFSGVMDDAAKKAQGPWSDAAKNLGHAWQGFLDTLGNTSLIKGTVAELENLAKMADYLATHAANASKPGAAGAAAAGGGGLPGGVQRAGVGPLGLFNSALTGGGILGAAGALLSPQQVVITPDIDAIVRTVIKEAQAGNAQGQQDVAAVILNRMAQSGLSAVQTVQAKGQFQPWDSAAGVKALMSIDQNSKEYKDALDAILPILEGAVADPTKGATNFYSPKGQVANVRNGLATQLTPSFAIPANQTIARNDQVFFKGPFPGQRPGADPNTATQAQIKAGDAYIEQLQEQIALQNKISDAERVRIAGVQALRAAEDAGANGGRARIAQQIAETEEQRKIDVERAAERKALLTQMSAAETAAAEGQDASLSQRLDAVTEKFKIAFATIDALRKQGLTTDEKGQNLDALEAQLKAYENIAKQQEQMKFYEQQLADLEKDRAAQVQAIQAQVDAGSLTPEAAVAATQEINAKLLPQIREIARQGEAFAASIKSAVPDPKLAAFVAQLQGAEAKTIGEGAKESLGLYDQAAQALTKQENDQLAAINALAAQGAIGSTEAFRRAQAVVGDLGPQISKLAGDAITFAEAINAATPNPQLQAFIDRMKLLQAQASAVGSTRSPANIVGGAQTAVEEQKLNDILSERSQIVEQYNTLQQQGAISQEEAQAKTAAAFAQFKPLIDAQIKSILDLVTAMHDAKDISDETFDAWKAKLGTISAQTEFVSADFTQLRDTITSSFAQGAVDAFDQVASSIASLINGTASWKDTLRSLGSAALNFAASFLKSIADILIQMLALKAIQSLPFLNSFVGGTLNFVGLGTGAAALGASAAATAAAGASITAGAAALGVSAAALEVAATTLLAANAAGAVSGGGGGGGILGIAASLITLHGGGVVGAVGAGTRRAGTITPGMLSGVPRYHRGRTGVGLSANEQLAILKKNEEVLTSDDPRNILNAGKNAKQKQAPSLAARIVAVFDPKEIHQAMAAPAGEQVIVTTIQKNVPTIKHMLGVPKG